jgi:hypothetical protein
MNIITLAFLLMGLRITLLTGMFAMILMACNKEDTASPMIILVPDSDVPHFRTEPFIEPGYDVADDQTCLTSDLVSVINPIDVNRYGNYVVSYSAEDEAGNMTTAFRSVDIVLPLADYYDQTWNAYDTCTSGNYFYTGLIQDCDCGAFAVTVGNISNFGLSATFTLPVTDRYNHVLTMDTVKSAVHFLGTGTMSQMADTLYWNYTIADSVATDVCRSVWIK